MMIQMILCCQLIQLKKKEMMKRGIDLKILMKMIDKI